MFSDRKRLILYAAEAKAIQVIEITTGRVLRSYPVSPAPFWIFLAEDQNSLAVRDNGRLYFLNLTTGGTYDAEISRTFPHNQ